METRETADVFSLIDNDDIASLQKLLKEKVISGKEVHPRVNTNLVEYAALEGNLHALKCLASSGFGFTRQDHPNPESSLGILFWACLSEDIKQKIKILIFLNENYEQFHLERDGITIAHIHAALGLGDVAIDDESAKSTTDQFGLYPYHYAGLSGLPSFLDWVPKGLDHYEEVTGKGMFADVTLQWLVARGGFENFSSLKNVNLNSRPMHIENCASISQLMLSNDRLDLFEIYLNANPTIILDLETKTLVNPPLVVSLCHGNNRVKLLCQYLDMHPNLQVNLNIIDDIQNNCSIALILVATNNAMYLKRHRSSVGPLDVNTKTRNFGTVDIEISLAHFLAYNRTFELLQGYIQDPHGPYVDLNSKSNNPNCKFYGSSLGCELAIQNRCDLIDLVLKHHPQHLDLNAGPIHTDHPKKGTTFAYYLALYSRIDIIENQYEKYQYLIDLNGGPQNQNDKHYGLTVLWILIYNRKYDLVEKLINQGAMVDLDAGPKKADDPNYKKTVAWMLVIYKNWRLLEKLIDRGMKFNLYGGPDNDNIAKRLNKSNKRLFEKCRTKFNPNPILRKKQESKNKSTKTEKLSSVQQPQSFSPYLREINNDEHFAKQIDKNLEILNDLLNRLDTNETQEAFNQAIIHRETETVSKKNLIKRYAKKILAYKDKLEKVQKSFKENKFILIELNAILVELRNNANTKQDQSKLSELTRTLGKLHNEISADIQNIRQLETNLAAAYSDLQKNIKNANSQFFASKTSVPLTSSTKKVNKKGKQNKNPSLAIVDTQQSSSNASKVSQSVNKAEPTNRAGNTSAKGRRRRKNRKQSNTNDKSSAHSTHKPSCTLTIKTEMDASIEKEMTQCGDLNFPLPTLKGEDEQPYYKHGTPPPKNPSIVETQQTFFMKTKPPVQRSTEEYINEIQRRLALLFTPLAETDNEKEQEFIECMSKFKLLKLLEPCYQLEKRRGNQNIRYIKGLRHLICHDQHVLTNKEVCDFIEQFKAKINSLNVEGVTIHSNVVIDALRHTINKDDHIQEKIDTFLELAKQKSEQPTLLLIEDFTKAVYVKEHLQRDIDLTQYLFTTKIPELLAEKKEGNALSILRELDPDLYSLCEFLIMSIYENMKKLNYDNECKILIELRNHISHDFDQLPVHAMQKFFAQDLPTILSYLDERSVPTRKLDV